MNASRKDRARAKLFAPAAGYARAIKLGLHVAVALFAYLLAYQIVLEPGLEWWASPAARHIIKFAVIYAGIAAVVVAITRSERPSWRYVSTHDALNLLRTTFLTVAVFLIVTFLFARAEGVPRSVLVLAWLGHFGGVVGLRLLRRLSHERSLVTAVAPMLGRPLANQRRLLLVGDLGAADAFLRELGRDPNAQYVAVGIVGLVPGDAGNIIRQVAVEGAIDDLERVVSGFQARKAPIDAILFLSPPDTAHQVPAEVLGRFKAAQVQLLRLPAMTEIGAAADSLPGTLREISFEELLPRPPVHLDAAQIYGLVNDKRVLVTGAGGSIGSELCRQVAAFGCAHLSMLDHSECALFKVDQEIAAAHPDLSRNEIICDVRDAARVHAAVNGERPDIVFHAAALKHVPLVEKYPVEGVLTNVVGTWNVAEAARSARAGQMVLISTDKAVDPSNVMGATKRLAEGIIRGQHGKSETRFSVVRFGNVLGSAGSVVPTFLAQIRRGGPLTVTHPDVERYFMSIPEAVQLVLYATAQSATRDLYQPSVFVLEMGEAVKIVELARNVAALHGLTLGVDIEMEFTGLRPGEKLTEDLIDTQERVLARMQSVIEVVDHDPSAALSAAQVSALEGLACSGDEAAVRRGVFEHLACLRGVPGSSASA